MSSDELIIRIVYTDLPTVEVRQHRADERGNIYTLIHPIHYRLLVVPAGFESDGASVPRIFWGYVFPSGDNRAMFAALVHDYIYRTHPYGWIKRDADDAFRDLLKLGGVPLFRAWKAYWGVRLFGGSAWNAGGKSK